MSSDPLEKFFFLIPAAGVGVVCLSAGGPITGLSSLQPLLWAVGIGVVLIVVGGRKVLRGHSHGKDRARVARHEAGHVVAARAVGGRVLSAELHRNGGGLVTWDMPAAVHTAENQVAFLLAGKYAAGTDEGCSGDHKTVKRILRTVPAAERGRARAAGDAKARRIVASRRGEIAKVAARLEERGRL